MLALKFNHLSTAHPPIKSSPNSTKPAMLLGLAIGGAMLAVGCTQPTGKTWKTVGELSDGLHIKFVEIAREKAKDKSTYVAAVANLCKGVRICAVGFFLPGDRIPPSINSAQFKANGGWSPYTPLTIWWKNANTGLASFTQWDCQRAGSDGAPLEALCGDGVEEAHRAILALAHNAGMAKACNWPKDAGPAVVATYTANIQDPGRRAFNRQAYMQMYKSSLKGPDNLADCQQLRPKLEEQAKQALKTLGY